MSKVHDTMTQCSLLYNVQVFLDNIKFKYWNSIFSLNMHCTDQKFRKILPLKCRITWVTIIYFIQNRMNEIQLKTFFSFYTNIFITFSKYYICIWVCKCNVFNIQYAIIFAYCEEYIHSRQNISPVWDWNIIEWKYRWVSTTGLWIISDFFVFGFFCYYF